VPIILFANNATSTLAGSISNVATTCLLAPGSGALFPSPSGGNFFKLTFSDAATGLLKEIVHCTARSADTLTIVRAQEGTTALAWTAGDIAANLLTAGTMEGFPQDDDNPGRLLGVLVVTASGAVSLPAGTNSIIVEGVGGGGGGGAADVTAAGEFSPGSGGGGGAWGKVRIATGLTSLVATIGAAGTGGVIGVNSGIGVAGGNTSLIGTFGSLLFPGGSGGIGSTPPFVPPAAVGGGAPGALATQSGGTPMYLCSGDAGGLGQGLSPTNGFSGVGGNSPLGSGGGEAGSSSDGANATGYGAGGGGALNVESQGTSRVGGNGTGGVLLISCYS